MRNLNFTLALAITLATTPVMAQSNGLFKPATAPQTKPTAQSKTVVGQPKSAAQAMTSSTATDSGGVLAPAAGGSQVIAADARVRTIEMRNYETCKYTINKVQSKLAGAQIRETTAGLVVTRRDNVATYVSACAPDGTMSTAVYTGGRAPPATIPGRGTPGTRTPSAPTQQR